MIGEETADEGAALLSTAIGELAEDLAGEAVIMIRADAAAWLERAWRLEAAGRDIQVLASAMTILMVRRDPPSEGEGSPDPDTAEIGGAR